MNQPTPAMQAMMWHQSLVNHYLNYKDGRIDKDAMLKHLAEHIDEAKGFVRHLCKNEWPKDKAT